MGCASSKSNAGVQGVQGVHVERKEEPGQYYYEKRTRISADITEVDYEIELS